MTKAGCKIPLSALATWGLVRATFAPSYTEAPPNAPLIKNTDETKLITPPPASQEGGLTDPS